MEDKVQVKLLKPAMKMQKSERVSIVKKFPPISYTKPELSELKSWRP
jgi:hypothetical protein